MVQSHHSPVLIISFPPLRTSLCGNKHNARKTSPLCHQRHTGNMQEKLGGAYPQTSHASEPHTSNRPSKKCLKNQATSIPAQGGMCSFATFSVPPHGRSCRVTTSFSLRRTSLCSQLTGDGSNPPHLVAGAHRLAPTSKMLNDSSASTGNPPCTRDRPNQGRNGAPPAVADAPSFWCDRSARSLPYTASHWSQLKVGRTEDPNWRRGSRKQKAFHQHFGCHADTSCFQAFGYANHNLSKVTKAFNLPRAAVPSPAATRPDHEPNRVPRLGQHRTARAPTERERRSLVVLPIATSACWPLPESRECPLAGTSVQCPPSLIGNGFETRPCT